MNLEAQQLISEIDRVATNSAFNGSKLIDGSYKAQDFQVGSGNDATDRITISIGSAKASALGTPGGTAATSTSAFTGAVNSAALLAGDLSINGFAISASVSDGISFESSSTSAIAKANAINASSSLTGITATVKATSVESGSITAAASTGAVAAGSLLINGVDIGALEAFTGAGNAAGRAAQVVGAINAKSSQTGVTATLTNTDKITMSATDGRNITANWVTATGLAGFASGGVASATTRGGLDLKSATGASSAAIAGLTITKIGTDLTGSSVALTRGTVTGQTVSSVDLSTQTGSQTALSILDNAIDTVTNSRANLGAYQNRFEAAISNLETTSTNLQASRSRILDTDYAKETTNLAKAQIVQQAATAMLAQANQSSQSVLALLK
jgi:flagellin